jgi:membrane-associated phospholipid phosphatase
MLGDPERGEAMIRLSLRILASYLIATTLPLLGWSVSTRSWPPLITHVAVCAVTILSGRSQRVAGWFQAWTPLALVPYLYVELRWIIAGAGRPHADRLIAGWDSTLFGSQPSSALALRWQSVGLSELLHLCYLSYYAVVFVPPAVLWLRKRDRAFGATVLAIVITYTVCFVGFVLLPVDGPRFLFGPSAAPEGPVRAVVIRILGAGSSQGTAFPSAHVAASVVAAICAMRFQRTLGIAIALLTSGMMVGAVYGGYHYAVDVLAGLATGLVTAAIARSAENATIGRSTTPG